QIAVVMMKVMNVMLRRSGTARLAQVSLFRGAARSNGVRWRHIRGILPRISFPDTVLHAAKRRAVSDPERKARSEWATSWLSRRMPPHRQATGRYSPDYG